MQQLLIRSNQKRLVIKPTYPRNHRPKFQAKFCVAKEEPDGPFQRHVERYSQGFCHHVSGFQDPGADGANGEGTPINLNFGIITLLNHT